MARSRVNQELAQAASGAIAKSAPPLAVVAAVESGAFNMSFWVGAATLVYVVLQGAYLVWKWRREARKP